MQFKLVSPLLQFMILHVGQPNKSAIHYESLEIES